jgi:hypothetical protein
MGYMFRPLSVAIIMHKYYTKKHGVHTQQEKREKTNENVVVHTPTFYV